MTPPAIATTTTTAAAIHGHRFFFLSSMTSSEGVVMGLFGHRHSLHEGRGVVVKRAGRQGESACQCFHDTVAGELDDLDRDDQG